MTNSNATYELRIAGDLVLETDGFLELAEQYEKAVDERGREAVEARRNGEPFRPGPSRLAKRFSIQVPR